MGSYDNSYTCSLCGKGFSDPGGWQLPRWISEHMEKMHPPQPGPVEKVKKLTTCTGCPALYTKEWDDYGENDYHDSGTSAFCLLKENRNANGHPMNITSYWSDNQDSPDWCPAK